MNKLQKLILFSVLFGLIANVTPSAFSKESDSHITGKTVLAGTLSLLIWPGIGQAVNNDKGDKVLTHAVLGLTGVYRFWSCYDAVVDRKGGYWEGRI
ncbi:MAG: hypothetical protein WC197_01525 [Candidatus Gastranaerophilaceae bacterium]|jgi:hypothetical protein